MEIYKTCIFYLVKGFEIYLKKRFIELGYYLRTHYDRLVTFYKKPERLKIKKEISASLTDGYSFLIPYLFSLYPTAISFQEYKTASEIYQKACGINFTRVPLIDNKTIEEIKASIKLRHLHTHSDNYPIFRKLSDERIIPSREHILELITRFNPFIMNLQQHTTRLLEDNFI